MASIRPTNDIAKWRVAIAEDNINNNQDKALFVAKMDGKVVSFTFPKIEYEGKRRLGALYIAKQAQGLGIGLALMQKALEWHGDNDVYLLVVSYNKRAITFYEHHGFVKTGVETPAEFDEKNGIKLLPETEMVHKGTLD